MKYEPILHKFQQLAHRDPETRSWMTDKEYTHRYGINYEWILNTQAQKLRRPLRILEIGISHWHPNSMDVFCALTTTAQYVAVDWVEYRFPKEIPSKATIIQDNAYKTETVKYLQDTQEPFDILIDDGNHKLKDQLFFLKHYRQLATKHGILIIEDFANIDTDLPIIKSKYPDIFVIDNRLNGYQTDSVLLIHGIPIGTTMHLYQTQKQLHIQKQEIALKYQVAVNDPEFEYIVWRLSKGKYYSDIYGKFEIFGENNNEKEIEKTN